VGPCGLCRKGSQLNLEVCPIRIEKLFGGVGKEMIIKIMGGEGCVGELCQTLL